MKKMAKRLGRNQRIMRKRMKSNEIMSLKRK